jgi:hypothetical protein
MTKLICTICENEFEAERSTAKFCSNKCRVKSNRLSVTENLSSPLSVTENPEVSVTNLSVTDEKPLSVTDPQKPKIFIDIVKDLKLNLEKDLGITGWTPDGIFIRPEITIQQVQNIARLIHAKHGRKEPIFTPAPY